MKPKFEMYVKRVYEDGREKTLGVETFLDGEYKKDLKSALEKMLKALNNSNIEFVVNESA